jgi:hypothetical protein
VIRTEFACTAGIEVKQFVRLASETGLQLLAAVHLWTRSPVARLGNACLFQLADEPPHSGVGVGFVVD